MQYNSFHNAFSQKYLSIHPSYVMPKHPTAECFHGREVVEMQADKKLSCKTLCVSTEGAGGWQWIENSPAAAATRSLNLPSASPKCKWGREVQSLAGWGEPLQTAERGERNHTIILAGKEL